MTQSIDTNLLFYGTTLIIGGFIMGMMFMSKILRGSSNTSASDTATDTSSNTSASDTATDTSSNASNSIADTSSNDSNSISDTPVTPGISTEQALLEANLQNEALSSQLHSLQYDVIKFGQELGLLGVKILEIPFKVAGYQRKMLDAVSKMLQTIDRFMNDIIISTAEQHTGISSTELSSTELPSTELPSTELPSTELPSGSLELPPISPLTSSRESLSSIYEIFEVSDTNLNIFLLLSIVLFLVYIFNKTKIYTFIFSTTTNLFSFCFSIKSKFYC